MPKPNAPVVIAAPTLEEHAGEDAAAQSATFEYMKNYFAAQPKVSVKCQEDQWVQINGYTFIIKGGERVMVPQGVADILEESGRI